MKIYVDLDGVLADFDKAAEDILATDNIYKYEFIWGADVFWKKINAFPNFFRDLPLKEDALKLWTTIERFNPEILTALPRDNGERVSEQKRAWVKHHLGSPSPVVHTCMTKDKPKLCAPGDILIDDRAVNRDAWMAAGGTYIIHTRAYRTIMTLEALGVI